MATAVAKLDGSGGTTGFGALLDALAPWPGRMRVAESVCMVGLVAVRKAAPGADLFGQGIPPVRVTFLKVLRPSLSSVASYWRLGSARVKRRSPRWELLLLGTAAMWLPCLAGRPPRPDRVGYRMIFTVFPVSGRRYS